MAYGDDIDALGAAHRYALDGDATDAIGTNDGTNLAGSFAGAAITRDSSNSWLSNAVDDRVVIPSIADINTVAQARKAVSGWVQLSAFQAPPTRLYGEGDESTCFQFCAGFGNNLIMEFTQPGDFPAGLQVFGPAMVPDRSYHLVGVFLGSAFGNEVKFFVDGVEQFNADPSNRQPGTTTLDIRGFARIADPSNDTGLGGDVVLQQAPRDGLFSQWAFWGDSADADLSDSEVRVTLFERGALADSSVAANTEANMQTALDALASAQPNAALCIEVEAVTGGGDFTLVNDKVFDDLASIHYRYNGTADTLTIVNTGSGNASIGSAPFGGSIVISQRQTLSVVARDASTNAAIEGARVYIEAAAGGPLAAGEVIMNELTNASGLATATFDYSSDQPVISRIRKGSSSPYYKTAPIAGLLTSAPLDVVVLMVSDE